MRKSNESSSNTKSKIVKIHRMENGHYEVYFKFLPIPVEMNKGYFHTIIKDLNTDQFDPLIA